MTIQLHTLHCIVYFVFFRIMMLIFHFFNIKLFKFNSLFVNFYNTKKTVYINFLYKNKLITKRLHLVNYLQKNQYSSQ